MLHIKIPENELFNGIDGEFIKIKEQTIQLEHSLVSLSKWESKWHKPFLGSNTKTDEETLDYIRCMTITQGVDPIVYTVLDSPTIQTIVDYINDPMTATWFTDTSGPSKKTSNGETITSELIYYWMITLNIPVEFQKWHLNRLITLIKVCNVKNEPPKKMGKRDVMNRNKALNEARRKAANTRG